jgi:hypothetical protein
MFEHSNLMDPMEFGVGNSFGVVFFKVDVRQGNSKKLQLLC